MPTARTVIIRAHGGPEVFELAEREVPAPAAGEVTVEQHAAGLNHPGIVTIHDVVTDGDRLFILRDNIDRFFWGYLHPYSHKSGRRKLQPSFDNYNIHIYQSKPKFNFLPNSKQYRENLSVQ